MHLKKRFYIFPVFFVEKEKDPRTVSEKTVRKLRCEFLFLLAICLQNKGGKRIVSAGNRLRGGIGNRPAGREKESARIKSASARGNLLADMLKMKVKIKKVAFFRNNLVLKYVLYLHK